MTRGQKNWFRRGGEPAELPASAWDVEGRDMPTKRIAAYAPAQNADPSSKLAEHGIDAESEAPSHRSTGEEVDAILQTARDSAANLMEAAREEAERTRAEANTVATREVEQARHRAQAEREEAAKVRAEAEADAALVRNEAEAAARKLHAEADEQATSLVEAARAKLAAAEAEVEQKLQAAEESAHARVAVLQAEERHHEERLELLLAVVRGMSVQLEAVLGGEGEHGRDVEPADQDRAAEHAYEDLGEALRPDARSEPVT